MYWQNRFFGGGSEDFLLATRSVTTNDRILKTEGCSKTSALKSQYQRYAYFIWCMVYYKVSSDFRITVNPVPHLRK